MTVAVVFMIGAGGDGSAAARAEASARERCLRSLHKQPHTRRRTVKMAACRVDTKHGRY